MSSPLSGRPWPDSGHPCEFPSSFSSNFMCLPRLCPPRLASSSPHNRSVVHSASQSRLRTLARSPHLHLRRIHALGWGGASLGARQRRTCSTARLPSVRTPHARAASTSGASTRSAHLLSLALAPGHGPTLKAFRGARTQRLAGDGRGAIADRPTPQGPSLQATSGQLHQYVTSSALQIDSGRKHHTGHCWMSPPPLACLSIVFWSDCPHNLFEC